MYVYSKLCFEPPTISYPCNDIYRIIFPLIVITKVFVMEIPGGYPGKEETYFYVV
jgi:hypothetical protein